MYSVIKYYLKKTPRVIKPPTMEIKFPPYILYSGGDTILVRAVVDNKKYPISILESISRGLSIGKLTPSDSLVFQFFNETYYLKNWNHEREISDDERKYLICEIGVYFEPLETDKENKAVHILENYRTVVRFLNK